MNTQTTEHAFESHVEATLLRRGWRRGGLAEWDVERALFPARVCAFIEATQPEPWAAMRALHGAGLEELLVDALVRELDVKGALHVLRHGFKFYGRTFRLAWFRPAHGRNDETLALYGENDLTVARQVSCHPGRRDTVDLLFAVNGLPVATCELKNPRVRRQLLWPLGDNYFGRFGSTWSEIDSSGPVDRVGGACTVQSGDGKRAVPAEQAGPTRRRRPPTPAGRRRFTARAGPAAAVGRPVPRTAGGRRAARVSWTAGTLPSRPGRKAHTCCLSGGTDGVSPEGPERSGGRA